MWACRRVIRQAFRVGSLVWMSDVSSIPDDVRYVWCPDRTVAPKAINAHTDSCSQTPHCWSRRRCSRYALAKARGTQEPLRTRAGAHVCMLAVCGARVTGVAFSAGARRGQDRFWGGHTTTKNAIDRFVAGWRQCLVLRVPHDISDRGLLHGLHRHVSFGATRRNEHCSASPWFPGCATCVRRSNRSFGSRCAAEVRLDLH